MNCADVRARLPALLDGTLAAGEASLLEGHLAACPGCRHDRDTLCEVTRLLDAVPAPLAEVDLARLYRDAATHLAARARRWRRTAVAAGIAAAAAVLLAAVLRLEVRVGPEQLVLRWGTPPAVSPPLQYAPGDDVLVLRQLVHALAADGRRNDDELARLRDRLADLQRRTELRLTYAERRLAALRDAQLVSLPKGEEP